MSKKSDLLVGMTTLVSKDDRRTIAEYNDKGMDFSVQTFLITDAIPLGNHYHADKDETFVVTRGGGFVRLLDTDVNGKVAETHRDVRLTVGSVVRVPAGVVHVFVLCKGSEMICYSSKAFDPKDMIVRPLMTAEEAAALIKTF